MKLIAIISFFVAFICAILAEDFCQSCGNFPIESEEHVNLNMDEWTNQNCVCQETFVQKLIEIDDWDFYCCIKERKV